MTKMAWPELPAVKRELVIKRKELIELKPGTLVKIIWHGGTECATFLGLGAGEMYRFANARGDHILINPRSSDLKWMKPLE